MRIDFKLLVRYELTLLTGPSQCELDGRRRS